MSDTEKCQTPLRGVTGTADVVARLGVSARALRSYDPSRIYHLTGHGVDDRPIFREDADFQDFALRLRRVGIRGHWEWHAACLMDTHYHLVFRPTLGRVSDGMRDLNVEFTQ